MSQCQQHSAQALVTSLGIVLDNRLLHSPAKLGLRVRETDLSYAMCPSSNVLSFGTVTLQYDIARTSLCILFPTLITSFSSRRLVISGGICFHLPTVGANTCTGIPATLICMASALFSDVGVRHSQSKPTIGLLLRSLIGYVLLSKRASISPQTTPAILEQVT